MTDIDITPAMLEAGVKALHDNMSSSWTLKKAAVVEAIYRAMAEQDFMRRLRRHRRPARPE